MFNRKWAQKEKLKRKHKKWNKKTKAFAIGILTVLAAIPYIYQNCTDAKTVINDIKRPDYQETAKELQLQVSLGDQQMDTTVMVNPRVYTAEQIAGIFEEISKSLESIMLGENSAPDNITEDVVFCQSVGDYPVTIQWLSDNYDVIDAEGIVHNTLFEETDSEIVVLTAILQYETYSAEYIYEVTVKPCDLTKLNCQKKISEKIQNADNDSKEEEYLALPNKINGTSIVYRNKADWNQVIIIIMLGGAAIIAVIFGEQNNRKKALEKRKKQLKNDYAEMVTKITLLVGAGMTMRRAWERIAEDYQFKLLHGHTKKKIVYEEMTESVNQLKAGVSEQLVYQEFGNRCDERLYMKFSSLLTQNLKKGSRELIAMLELETKEAFEERKNIAKRYGEEAGTKLLAPMIMMLFVVMVIVIVPALMNFSV